MPPTCIFCGSPANSREHMWPDWLNEVLPDYTETVYSLGSKTWKSKKPATHRVGAVCHSCNTGWMARLESEARPLLTPMINGRKQPLDKPHQLIVAAWAVKTAMIGEQLNPKAALIPADQRAFLAEHCEPPMWTKVSIGATDAKWPGDTHYSEKKLKLNVSNPTQLAQLRAKSIAGDAFIGYAATLVIRHLALQVIGPFIDATFAYTDPVKQHVRTIWPFDRSFNWPTTRVLNPYMLGALIEHFRGDASPKPPF